MKKTITESLDGDYISDLDGLTVAQAIDWLNQYPQDAVLSENWTGYESCQGDIDLSRQETDEEYRDRLEMEAEQQREANLRAEKKRLDDQKNIDMAVEQCNIGIEQLKEKIALLNGARPK